MEGAWFVATYRMLLLIILLPFIRIGQIGSGSQVVGYLNIRREPLGDPLSSLISGAMLCALAFIIGYIAAHLWQWRNK